jgi:hypothetical protein
MDTRDLVKDRGHYLCQESFEDRFPNRRVIIIPRMSMGGNWYSTVVNMVFVMIFAMVDLLVHPGVLTTLR